MVRVARFPELTDALIGPRHIRIITGARPCMSLAQGATKAHYKFTSVVIQRLRRQ